MMITCKDFDGFLLDYLEGQLPLRQHLQFSLHMKLCRDCRRYLRDYRRAVRLGQSLCGLAEDRVPDTVPEELIEAVLAGLRNS